MAGKDIIVMTQEELKRLHVIHKALNKSITQAEAADIIDVCLRQAQRIRGKSAIMSQRHQRSCVEILSRAQW